MKNLANLNGAKALSKKEQKSINGGGGWCIGVTGNNNSTPCVVNGNSAGCCRDGICLPLTAWWCKI